MTGSWTLGDGNTWAKWKSSLVFGLKAAEAQWEVTAKTMSTVQSADSHIICLQPPSGGSFEDGAFQVTHWATFELIRQSCHSNSTWANTKMALLHQLGGFEQNSCAETHQHSVSVTCHHIPWDWAKCSFQGLIKTSTTVHLRWFSLKCMMVCILSRNEEFNFWQFKKQLHNISWQIIIPVLIMSSLSHLNTPGCQRACFWCKAKGAEATGGELCGWGGDDKPFITSCTSW